LLKLLFLISAVGTPPAKAGLHTQQRRAAFLKLPTEAKKTLKRMQDIDKLDDNTRDKLFFLIDNVVQNSKAKKAFAS